MGFATPGVPQYGLRKPQGKHVPLQTAAQSTFGADGSARVFTGPSRAGQEWHVQRLVTTAGADGDHISLMVYRNSESPSNLIDSTLQGGQATSETDVTLYEGERLVCVWTGGTPNTQAIIVISGEVDF